MSVTRPMFLVPESRYLEPAPKNELPVLSASASFECALDFYTRTISMLPNAKMRVGNAEETRYATIIRHSDRCFGLRSDGDPPRHDAA